MDVQINELTSNIHLTDARAMLTPEVLAQIVEAVTRALQEQERERQARERDTQIERRAARLDEP